MQPAIAGCGWQCSSRAQSLRGIDRSEQSLRGELGLGRFHPSLLGALRSPRCWHYVHSRVRYFTCSVVWIAACSRGLGGAWTRAAGAKHPAHNYFQLIVFAYGLRAGLPLLWGWQHVCCVSVSADKPFVRRVFLLSFFCGQVLIFPQGLAARHFGRPARGWRQRG